MARFLTVLSFVLLATSVVLIIQFGVPAIVARGIPQSTSEPTIPATLPATQVTAAATLAATAPAAPTVQSKAMINPEAAALVALLNDQRKAAGLSVLTTSDALTTAATRISAVMARGQTLAKDQIETAVKQAGYPYKTLWTSSISATNASAQQLFDAWLRDAQSQKNWQNADYKDVGLGITQDAVGQRHYVILLGAPMTLTAPGADINQPGDPSQQGQAQAILNLLNAARVNAGLKPLTLNDKLTAAALAHSRDQAQMDTMTHEGSDKSQVADRVKAAGYQYSVVGENVLQRPDIHAGGAFDQWWNSPPHHENMMRPDFTEMGLAYAVSQTGQYYYTMVLGSPQ